MHLGLHEEAAGGDEEDEQDGAEGEDVADAEVVGEQAGEDEAADLRGEDGGHDGGADAAHERGWGSPVGSWSGRG